MNNELEELLDYISDRVIGKEKWNKVRDYMTNLQQENNNLKTSLDESQEVVIELQQENKDNEQLIETQLRGLEKQKQIIDKAIEYLKGNACYIESNIFVDDLCCDECMELLNILKGEDNE